MINITYNILPSDSRKWIILNGNNTISINSKTTTLTDSGSPQNAYFINKSVIDPQNQQLVTFLSKHATKKDLPNLPKQDHYVFNEDITIIFSDSTNEFFSRTNFSLKDYKPRVVIGLENQIKIQRTAYSSLGRGFEWFVHLYDNHTLGSFFNISIDESNLIVEIEYKDIYSILSVASKPPTISNKASSIVGYNKIIYGVPGNGKSTIVDDLVKSKTFERVLFHPDYSYSDFVGQLKPNNDANGNPTYEFQPGIFTHVLAIALANPNDEVYLVIEEINRGNASGIFGDIFQLLDRNNDDLSYPKGQSKFKITNQLIQKYLFQKNLIKDINEKVFIPYNLILIGTMNTNDQNVFTIDTSFKRRWIFEFAKNDISVCPFKAFFVPKTNISWATFHKKINEKILGNQGLISSFDDKQIGPFFIQKTTLSNTPNNNDDKLARLFAHKIFEYLWNDVSKLSRQNWFPKFTSLENLIDDFTNNGLKNIFPDFEGN